MGRKIDISLAELSPLIRKASDKKTHFLTMVSNYMKLRDRRRNNTKSVVDLESIQKEAEQKYAETLDESVFSAVHEAKRKADQSQDDLNSMIKVVEGGVKSASVELDAAIREAAAAAQVQWGKVADSEVKKLERQIAVSTAKVLYIKRKINNGNYSESMFFESIGCPDLAAAARSVIEEQAGQIPERSKEAVEELPDIPHAETFKCPIYGAKPASRIVLELQDDKKGSRFHPWPSLSTL